MKFYSEVTKRFYDSAKECVADETKVIKEREEEEARKKKLEEIKESRKKEIEDTINKAEELLKSYCEDYGVFSSSNTHPNFLYDFLF